ncbi:hypothetical protein [Amycolatopsis keratiniphila]|uniref:hypothetical protein n=1 Tax=Amycolatopsis keratiniphila TaxID=129921 RepID=UPI00087C9CD8|nr:hypothetical protein [Amycolatopsis keratiniphila]SDU67463.1 hypothetical protein SAMN04489733_8129 [Amycolatopsis keratiniphila]
MPVQPKQELLNWLGQVVDLRSRPEHLRYPSTEALVISVGRWFTPATLPPGHSRGPHGLCFANATSHSRRHGLSYVEGFALTDAGLVAPHAWCAHPDGTVEDPTWDDAGRAYLGIAFTPDYLAEFEARRGAVTVLFDQHLDDMRLLREGLPENAFADSGIPHHHTPTPDVG